MRPIPREEYPRPQLVRENWMNLNGEWDFSFDTENYDRKIMVPFAYQSVLSGICTQDIHDIVWYRRNFDLPASMEGKEILLHFGAVDYECDIWVNDIFITHHVGGHINFTCDITHAVKQQGNILRVKVRDETLDMEMPRGKQYWKEQSESIFYTRTTGIWQTVWLEAVSGIYIKKLWMTPDLDEKSVEINYEINTPSIADMEIRISIFDTVLTTVKIKDCKSTGTIKIGLNQQSIEKWNFQEDLTWSPENPRLFDVELTLKTEGRITDEVVSYFGMRKVSIDNGKIMLNNRFYYQKLLLDQGYWQESLLTAPSDQAFIDDIAAVKAMGFNGVRKHQKIEDPRFLYHADRMGLLVWGEMAAAYVYSRNYVKRITDEWMAAIERDYNHPCIVAWTPLNESWGVPNIKDNKYEQAHSAAMVYLTKSLDQSRMVISNDGWEHTCTDILTIHDYEADKTVLKERYARKEEIPFVTPARRPLFADGWSYEGQPVMLTEVGGISYRKDKQQGWGYSSAETGEDFAKRYHAVISAIMETPEIQGFCYTQLTDVEQEINGLLTYGREFKIQAETIRQINEGKWKE